MFFDFKISGVFIGPDFNIYHISDFGLPIDKFTLVFNTFLFNYNILFDY